MELLRCNIFTNLLSISALGVPGQSAASMGKWGLLFEHLLLPDFGTLVGLITCKWHLTVTIIFIFVVN